LHLETLSWRGRRHPVPALKPACPGAMMGDAPGRQAMKTMHFSTFIQAGRPAVWHAMLAPDSYRRWTAPFAEGSYYEGSWDQGATIRFLAPDGGGMISVIAENRPNEFLSIKHIGQIKDGREDFDSDEVRSWAPAFENYTLKDAGASTELKVDLQVAEDFEDVMASTWPKALQELKKLCETSSPRQAVPGRA
jgi:hypothetical protein